MVANSKRDFFKMLYHESSDEDDDHGLRLRSELRAVESTEVPRKPFQSEQLHITSSESRNADTEVAASGDVSKLYPSADQGIAQLSKLSAPKSPDIDHLRKRPQPSSETPMSDRSTDERIMREDESSQLSSVDTRPSDRVSSRSQPSVKPAKKRQGSPESLSDATTEGSLSPQMPESRAASSRQRQTANLNSNSRVRGKSVTTSKSAVMEANGGREERSQPRKRQLLSLGTRSKSTPFASSKRRQSGPARSEKQCPQIFASCVFYFYPNSTVNRSRRFRIEKTAQHGASRAVEWDPAKITHLVLDKDAHFEHFLKTLDLKRVPDSITVVNELYPADCIAFGTLLEPRQRQYEALGADRCQDQKQASADGVTQPVQRSQSQRPVPDVHSASDATTPTIAQVSFSDVPSGQGATTSASTESERPQLELVKQRQVKWSTVRRDVTSVAPKHYNDALEEAVSQAKDLRDLPFDESEGEDAETLDKASSTSADEISTNDLSRAARSAWQEQFSCMHKNDGHAKDTNPNADTIETLQKMANYYDRVRDHWRTLAYRRAIGTLKRQERKVLFKEEARKLPFVGARLADKIEEIVWTRRLRRLENTEADADDLVLQLFAQIYGVGYQQAMIWAAQGFKTLEDLRLKAALTKNQQIGLAHFDDFNSRIPREEMTAHGDYVRSEAAKVCAKLQLTLGGSYRRGAETSGDIDFLVTAPDTSEGELSTLVFECLIPHLQSTKYLKCSLASAQGGSGSKWHGACCLPGKSGTIWRRVDFLVVPDAEWGAALIYFTGNDIFNRSIRLLASKKGLRLNQRGLFKDVARGPERQKATEGTLVEARSEERIFELLGVPWRPPEHRVC